MKKTLFYVVALLVGVWSGCSEVENLSQIEDGPEQFVAIMAEGESRTSLGDDGKSVNWEDEDCLAIFRKNAYNYKYELTSGEASKNATFKYAGVFTPGDATVTGIDKYYAVYPYNNDITINSNKQVTVQIPAEQVYNENSFDSNAAFMFAASASTELSFQNAHALLKIALKCMPGDSYNITSITLSSASKALNGPATIEMENNELVVTLSGTTDANKKLTLNINEGCTITGPTTVDGEDVEVPFYLVVTPGTYTDLSLSLTYDGVDEPVVLPINQSLTIGRNEIWTINYTCGSDEFTGTVPEFDSTDKDANQQ